MRPLCAPLAAFTLTFTCFAIGIAPPAARASDAAPSLASLATRAAGGDEQAIASLRERGPAGLDALFDTYADRLASFRAALDSGAAPKIDPELRGILDAIDHVAGQRDAAWSHLYWYTDFDGAKAQAEATGKPILSLRLLGRLDEEFSCANSRFFRTALYANKAIADELREHYVLHWKSVRPVPRITIDFGDGRTLERTITGNSIHYVLAPDGRVIDALPGLYAPATFLAALKGAARDAAPSGDPSRPDSLVLHAWTARAALDQAWMSDAEAAPVTPAARAPGRALVDPSSQASVLPASQSVIAYDPPPALGAAPPPDAAAAGLRAFSKGALETPLLVGVGFKDARRTPLDEGDWDRLAALHRDEARLDASSRSLIRAHMLCAEGTCAGPRPSDSDVANTIDAFERSIAQDTARNEYEFRHTILGWIARSNGRVDLDGLNERVYAQLFLTPSSDPWLGLVPAETYSGLWAQDERTVDD